MSTQVEKLNKLNEIKLIENSIFKYDLEIENLIIKRQLLDNILSERQRFETEVLINNLNPKSLYSSPILLIIMIFLMFAVSFLLLFR